MGTRAELAAEMAAEMAAVTTAAGAQPFPSKPGPEEQSIDGGEDDW
jgi:hypothetical protein|eukprot:COSAG01_NODE_4588_length_4893_cov_88.707551_7_plen_46_part_00